MLHRDVTLFILTDGFENCSRQWGKPTVATETTWLQADYGWDFYFAAGNQDAMATGATIGVQATQCISFDPSRRQRCETRWR